MLLIAIDTSGRHGSVALCRGDQNSFTTLQLTSLEGGTYSARLMPAIAEMLGQQQIAKEQLDALVVVSGPGSFTGLRVGSATVKGLCEVLHRPLVAVTMLEAVAIARRAQAQFTTPLAEERGFSRAGSAPSRWAFAPGGNPLEAANVTVALDAGRGEVYAGDFALEHSRAACVREYIAKLDAFASAAASNHLTVLTPDPKVADALTAAGAQVQQSAPVHADEIGRIGLAKLLAGETVNHATLDANYIRRSDAEIFAPKH